MMSIERLQQIRSKQLEKLEAMQKAGESKDRIDNMKFAIKITERRIERAQATDYEESIKDIMPLGGEPQC